MTTDEALNLIKAEMAGDDSDLRNRVARAALQSAVGAFNRLGNFWWNQKNLEFTLSSSSTGEYEAESLWPGYVVRRIEPTIWYVGENRRIEVLNDIEVFNNLTKANPTDSGQPKIACFHSNTGILNVWPVPGSDYTCTVIVYFLITKITDLPVEYHDLVVDRAVMMAAPSRVGNQVNPAWQAAKDSWIEGRQEVLALGRLLEWTGTQIPPDEWTEYASTSGRTSNPDSSNLTGL